MKLMIISNGVPLEDRPLLGIFEFDQAKALTQAGIEVCFLGVDLRSLRRWRKWGITHGVQEGVQWYNISWPVGAVPVGLHCRIGALALEKLYHYVVLKNSKPDIIHAHFWHMGNIAAKLAQKENVPFVITEHSSSMCQKEYNERIIRCAAQGYYCAKKLICVSTALSRSVKDKTGIDSIVIPNLLSTEDFQSVGRKKTDRFGFVFTGNLIEGKKPGLLLKAFSTISQRYPDTRLGIIGDGELRSALEKQVHELDLEEKIVFYGRLTRKEIAEVYQEYDCFALPSAGETFGVAYIEALAAGLPVIATRCGGPEDFITEENGILIDVDCEEQLIQAMEYMYINRNAYDARRLSSAAKEQFSPKKITQRLQEVYGSLTQ